MVTLSPLPLLARPSHSALNEKLEQVEARYL